MLVVASKNINNTGTLKKVERWGRYVVWYSNRQRAVANHCVCLSIHQTDRQTVNPPIREEHSHAISGWVRLFLVVSMSISKSVNVSVRRTEPALQPERSSNETINQNKNAVTNSAHPLAQKINRLSQRSIGSCSSLVSKRHLLVLGSQIKCTVLPAPLDDPPAKRNSPEDTPYSKLDRH